MIDVNGTRFQLLFGQEDWEGVRLQAADKLAWNEAEATLSLAKRPFFFPTAPADTPPDPAKRRGAGRDQFGNWYWIDASEQKIRILSAGSGQASDFWSPEMARQPQPKQQDGSFKAVESPESPPDYRLRGLTVTDHHYLVVGTLAPQSGLLIFDLHAAGAPTHWLWPAEIGFNPFDMTPALDGGVWILEREPLPRYWWLNREFGVVTAAQDMTTLRPLHTDDFQPIAGSPVDVPPREFPQGVSLAAASPVAAETAVSIEGLPDGTVLILDGESIYRYRLNEQVGEPLALTAVAPQIDPDAASLHGYDIAFAAAAGWQPGQPVRGTLYLVDSGGNQAWAFDLLPDDTALSLELQESFYPMRLFGGKGVVAAAGRAYYDMGERWLPLAAQQRPRYEGQAQATAPGEQMVFDGQVPACTWHRLLLDACIPPGAEVRVESRAADLPDLVPQLPWRTEPQLYLRHSGSEIPWHHPFADKTELRTGTGTWELLFQQAVGRYLQIRLTLRGSGRNSPRLRALRLYYPRFSYLKEYLPAVYGQDEAAASFLDRFLANVEGMYTALEGRIAEAQLLFSPDTIPSDYLDWLGQWFGVMLDEQWDEARKRLFLRHAMQLFRQRGTLPGLIRAVRLATDECPDETLFTEPVGNGDNARFVFSLRVVESFLTRQMAGVEFGNPADLGTTSLFVPTEKWTPVAGAAWLHQIFRDFLADIYRRGDGSVDEEALTKTWGTAPELPPLRPAESNQKADWQRFIQSRRLGFTYADVADTEANAARYQRFLLRRYRRIDALNQAWQQGTQHAYTDFSAIPLSLNLPAEGVALQDWIQFVSVVLPLRHHAHHFTVLVPTTRNDAQTYELIERVRRIVALEKPAHTAFAVQPYWALFRVGEARTGLDTLLGQGSRFTALLVGGSYLNEGYLGASHPWSVADRMILGGTGMGQHGPL